MSTILKMNFAHGSTARIASNLDSLKLHILLRRHSKRTIMEVDMPHEDSRFGSSNDPIELPNHDRYNRPTASLMAYSILGAKETSTL
jgi:hypothetical protein